MIINKLMGGLGNQMFQWACGKNLSLDNNLEQRLETSWYSQGIYGREFRICDFPNLTFKYCDWTENISETIFEPHNFDYVDFKKIKNNIKIEGYWQNKKYFEKNVDEIIKDFSMNLEKKNELIEKYPVSTQDSVSLHVRRGDYLSNWLHPVLPVEYYHNALEIIKDYKNVLIFSDDIEWCKENFEFRNLTFVEDLSDIDSLWLMSLCNNNIIANSSFSWWGAFLNSNYSKKIIAPKIWFGQGSGIDSTSICPYDWIII
jgi:hypothetical protein